MALEDVHDETPAQATPHADEIADFRKFIGEEEFQKIDDWLMGKFARQEWVNTTFTAPKHWDDTPLASIWEYCHTSRDDEERRERSAELYGRVVYSILFDRPEAYQIYRPEGHRSDDARMFGLAYRLKFSEPALE